MSYIIQTGVHEFGTSVINALDLHTWNNATTVSRVRVGLMVTVGSASLELIHIQKTGTKRVIQEITQDGVGTACGEQITISELSGMLLPEIKLHTKESRARYYFETSDAPSTPNARINFICCTFKRAEYIQKNTEIFRTYLRLTQWAGRSAHLTIVDNGQDCGVSPGPHVTVHPNANKGGAGGFGRGMYETCYGVQSGRGFTHLCLMDDDILLHPEMFARTVSMARFLKPGFHLGAPMYPLVPGSAVPKESACFGHQFKGGFHPSDNALGKNLDTKNFKAFIQMSRTPDSTGWWWDCISIDDVKRVGLPYPFFIKMDDVEYSLRLRDAGVNLAIPTSFWVLHEDFEEKYSASMQYYRYRNRWLITAFNEGFTNQSAFLTWFRKTVRNFIEMRQYEHAELLLSALSDFLKGPEYLIKNEARILKNVLGTVVIEKNSPIEQGANFKNGLEAPASKFTQLLNRVTVNNHFLPLNEIISIDTKQKSTAIDTRRAKSVTYLNSKKGVGFTVHRNSLRALTQVIRLKILERRARNIETVGLQYKMMKERFTGSAFWATYGLNDAPLINIPAEPSKWMQDVQADVMRLRKQLNKTIWKESRTNLEAVDQDAATLNAMRNIHLGKRCFIIGNGPSLTIKDLDKLKNEYTFASNKIYLAFTETAWRPTFYSVEDSMVAKTCATEIISLEGCTKIFPDHMLPFIPRRPNHIYSKWLPPLDNLSPGRDFSNDLVKGVCWGSTITYSMLQMAVHMGFKEIYLLGIDHSYIEPETKSADNVLISSGERNHFHPDYRKPGEEWHVPVLEKLEQSYRHARTHCDNIGIKIVNVSRKTKLDVFVKADLDKVLAKRAN